LIENGWRVLFTRCTDLVQKLQAAQRDLQVDAAIAKLDQYHLLILGDVAYVSKDQSETSVMFELYATRFRRQSLSNISNQPYGEWHRILLDQSVAVVVVDHFVHHAAIFGMKAESY
jgi:DNA replication protein DnaC